LSKLSENFTEFRLMEFEL